VARLYLDCDSVFPKTYLPSFGCTMKPAVDQYRGRVMEIVARAPLACPMKRASDILWQELSTVRKYPDKVYRYVSSLSCLCYRSVLLMEHFTVDCNVDDRART
jgi:hypothetical protein